MPEITYVFNVIFNSFITRNSDILYAYPISKVYSCFTTPYHLGDEFNTTSDFVKIIM